MKSPKVSVITPVYKAETTLRKCLDSFLAQTMQEWELILVDDGSPDASGSICDEYANRDSRFRVIHQKNAGVSAARQTGLEAATGEYVIHADPDDWVEPKMLGELHRKAKEDDADMVICDYYVDIKDHTIYRQQCPKSLDAQAVLNEMFSGQLHGSCCNKLVRRDCIERCAARFPDGINYCEDVCFNVQLLKSPINVCYLNMAFYHYVQHSTSTTNKFTRNDFEEGLKYIEFLSTLLPNESYAILRTKEWLKKESFKHQVLTASELDSLYPDVKKVREEGLFQSIMYLCAFNKCHALSRLLYNLYMKFR